MKKQTAVEWLFAHLLPFLEFSDLKEREHFRKCLSEAKAMEREQIVDANAEGQYLQSNFLSKEKCKINAEYFFYETYGGEQ